ncbi:hypothetical protein ACFLQ6_09345 [Thermoproteota archaeon]
MKCKATELTLTLRLVQIWMLSPAKGDIGNNGVMVFGWKCKNGRGTFISTWKFVRIFLEEKKGEKTNRIMKR